MHIGQVVEDDRGRQPEHLALAREEGALELLAMLPELVADAVQLLQRGGPAVQAEHFPSGTGVGQPAVRGALAAGLEHAGDQQGEGDAGVAVADAAGAQRVRQAELLEGVQRQAFAADRARAAVPDGVEMHGGQVVVGSRVGIEADRFEVRGDAPGEGEQLGVGGHERRLVGAQVLDERHEGGPVALGHGELGAEVEQGDLAGCAALGAHTVGEAEGVVLLPGGVAAGSGVDAADVHSGTSVAGRVGEQTAKTARPPELCHYSDPEKLLRYC